MQLSQTTNKNSNSRYKMERKKLGRPPGRDGTCDKTISVRIPKFWTLALPEDISKVLREYLRKKYVDKIIMKEKI